MYQNSHQQPTEKNQYSLIGVCQYLRKVVLHVHVYTYTGTCVIRLKLLVFLEFISFISYTLQFLMVSLPLFDFPLAQVGLNYENQEPDCSHLNRGQWWVLLLLLRPCVIQLFQILKYKVNECIWFWFKFFLYYMCINLNANSSFMIYKAYRKTKINF